MAILIGSLVPAALLLPTPQIAVVDLPATWQVSALLVCAMVSGPRAGVIAAVAYLSMGFINLPVFHGGGGFAVVWTSQSRLRRLTRAVELTRAEPDHAVLN